MKEALTRALDWLDALTEPPGFEARSADAEAIACEAPYAVALLAGAWRHVAEIRKPKAPIEDWLAAACDADGMVRFFGPGSDVIGPDLDDTAMVWAERRALSGWSPPKHVREQSEGCRLESGAYNTWPSPPESGPALEVDAVVCANILAMVAAEGRQDPALHRWLQSALDALDSEAPPRCPYYPDLAMLVIAALRAEALGAPAFRYPRVRLFSDATLLGLVARALLGEGEALERLLALQQRDGSFPWAPIFVGGEENQFPDGRRMTRPWYGGEAASTALACWAIAQGLGLIGAEAAPARGPMPTRRKRQEPWEAHLGPLVHGVHLKRRMMASRALPELDGPDGALRLDIDVRPAMPRFFRAGSYWALGYRGKRSPSAQEVAAMERLLALLDKGGPPEEGRKGPARIQCHAPNLSDLAGRLEAEAEREGPVSVAMPQSLDVPSALPYLYRALRASQGEGPELRFEGLPHCALPWPEELVSALGPDARRRQPAPACGGCHDAHRCAGPAGGALRPRSSTGPWVPLRRAAEAWRARFGHPAPEHFIPIIDALHDLQGGPLSGVGWSIVLVADVNQGRVDPSFRIDAFYGAREGDVVPGEPVLARLQDLDDRLKSALSAAAQRCPLHPAAHIGDGGLELGAYADTGHLSHQGAWVTLNRALSAIGRATIEPRSPELSVLGFALAPGGDGPTLDLYLTIPEAHQGPLQAPEGARGLAQGNPTICTLRIEGKDLVPESGTCPGGRSGETMMPCSTP